MTHSTVRFFLSLVLLITSWKIACTTLQLPNYILPAPDKVFLSLCENSSNIFYHASITLYETLAGLFFGGLFAIASAIILILAQPLRLFFLPLLLLSQAIPTFAIAPILILWFGFGIGSKIIIVIMMIFFPMTCALFDGLNKTPSEYLDMAKLMNSKKINSMRYIHLPYALPYFASGLRISVVIAPLAAIIGEWVGSSQGLGYLMLNANARLETNILFASLSVLVCMSLALYFLVDISAKRWITW